MWSSPKIANCFVVPVSGSPGNHSVNLPTKNTCAREVINNLLRQLEVPNDPRLFFLRLHCQKAGEEEGKEVIQWGNSYLHIYFVFFVRHRCFAVWIAGTFMHEWTLMSIISCMAFTAIIAFGHENMWISYLSIYTTVYRYCKICLERLPDWPL